MKDTVIQSQTAGHIAGLAASQSFVPVFAKVITDTDGVVLEVNPTFTEVTGYSRDEVLGRTLSILSSGYHSPAFYEELWRCLKEEGYWSGEIWNRRKDTSVFAEMITITALWDKNRRTSYYVGTFSDITPLRREQLKAMEAARAMVPGALTDLPPAHLASGITPTCG